MPRTGNQDPAITAPGGGGVEDSKTGLKPEVLGVGGSPITMAAVAVLVAAALMDILMAAAVPEPSSPAEVPPEPAPAERPTPPKLQESEPAPES